MAGSAVFIDTNILVYASFPETPFHDPARALLRRLQGDGASLCTSRQVLREFLACTTRPGTVLPPPTPAALSDAIRQFEAQFVICEEDPGVTDFLLGLLTSRTIRGRQIHDANIVATMLRYGIPVLLTHNTS